MPSASIPHVILIDNVDSFSYNLVDALRCLGARVDVYRNSISVDDVLEAARIDNTSLVVLSPGPGKPEDAGCCIPLIQQAQGMLPMLGVCLGHQAMVTALGGIVGGAGEVVHGRTSRLRRTDHPMWEGLPSEFDVARYHSLVAHQVPDCLEVTAWADDLVMAVAHRTHPLFGVQFHPESILTTVGQRLLGRLVEVGMQFDSARAANRVKDVDHA